MAGRGRIFKGVRSAVQESPSSLSLSSSSSSSSRLDLRTNKADRFHPSSLSYGREVPHCPKMEHSSVALGLDTTSSPGHTIFTLPGATQNSVIDAVRNKLRVHLPQDVIVGEGRAAVILATPRHASWLTDTNFMSLLVSSLRPPGRIRGPALTPNFHVLAAVVDGLCPRFGSHEMQHGLSIQFGTLANMLPGLWDNTTEATQSGRSDPEPSYLSMFLRSKGSISAAVPLANTLFQTGRRSTLLASEWGASSVPGRPFGAMYEPLRVVEKHTQKIDLSRLSPPPKHKLTVRSPLLPITHPRMILEGLGNILSKVDVEGQPSPASKELQANIPRWIEARRSQPGSEHASGPVGVWAFIIPRDLVGLGDGALEASPETIKKALLNFQNKKGWWRLGTATAKLAFEMSMEAERMAWELSPFLSTVMAGGGHLHKILSGGGEWGAKASLLSLDPKTSYGQESDETELEKFQKSFHGDDDADGAIARPGDFVQFFVERDPGHKPMSAEQRNRMSPVSMSYPAVSFGAGDLSMRDEEQALPGNVNSIGVQRELSRVELDHFGALSAEGVYLKSSWGMQTKLDVPGTTVSISGSAKPGVFNGKVPPRHENPPREPSSRGS